MSQLFQKLIWITLLLVVFSPPAKTETHKMMATWAGMNNWTARPLNFDGVLTPEPNICVKPHNDACQGVDLDNLIQDILDSNSNTYYYTMSNKGKFWAKFPEFLDKLYQKDAKIKVYPLILPKYWTDVNLDWQARTHEIAALAKTHPNLAGLAIDDYDGAHYDHGDYFSVANLQTMRNILDGTYSNGRKLDLYITAYLRLPHQAAALLTNPAKLKTFEINNGSEYVFDGVILGVVWGSNGILGEGIANAHDIPVQLDMLKNNLINGTKIFTLLYATGYGGSYNTELQYLRDATNYAMDLSDGVVMYRLHTAYMNSVDWASNAYQFNEKKVLIPELLRAKDTQQLTNVQSVYNNEATTGRFVDFKVELPANARNLIIQTGGGTGNADIYVRNGLHPTVNSYEYRSNASGTTEYLKIDNPPQGTNYIMIRAASTFESKHVNVSWDEPLTGNGLIASAKSCGWWDCASELKFNGQTFNFSASWAMMVVDPITKNIVSSTAYDVYNVATEAARMITDMNNIPYGSLVIVGTQDEPSGNSTAIRQNLCSNFGSCNHLGYLNPNSMYYMIGFKGQTTPIAENYKTYQYGFVNSLSSGSLAIDFPAIPAYSASVTSCGWWDCVGELAFNEHTLSTGGGSWSIMVIDPATKNVTSQGSYDVHNNFNEGHRLANDLINIPMGHLVIVGTQDEPWMNANPITQNLCTYFNACTQNSNYGFRGMYYMIGIKGQNPIASEFKVYDHNATPNFLMSGNRAINF